MTKVSQAIKIAASRGYKADQSGNVYGPSGERLSLTAPTDPARRYLTFSVKAFGRSVKVPAHRFIAFLKFGDSALFPKVHARHLNDNPTDNRWENIAIGSASDNMMDRSAEARRLHAQRAGRGNSLPDEIWNQVEADRANGATYKQITDRYGISKGTLSFRLSTKAKKRVMPRH